MGKCLFMRKGETHTAPSTGILASDLAVGSSVYLNENGSPVEYLVVNQGIPSDSSLYDGSCDGVWLLRKDCYESRKWHDGSGMNNYGNSTIHSYLNSTYLNLLGEVEQEAVKEVAIPYSYGGSVFQISSSVFLLSAYECGWVKNASIPDIVADGGCLSYFDGLPQVSSVRIAYLNGTATDWFLRSAVTGDYYNAEAVNTAGNWTAKTTTNNVGIRPALILPSNALFDKNTLILKGVA